MARVVYNVDLPVLLKLVAGYTKGVMIKWRSIQKIVR